MAARANWKGFIKVTELTCAVALYTAASTSERIAFHTLNRKTGNRVRRQFIDSETGEPVEADAQVKGYDTGDNRYVMLEPEEIAAAIPDSDKTLAVETFIDCGAIDDVYFDKPYYLAPTDAIAGEAFAVLRDGMAKKKSAALARTVLFRRLRTVLIRPHGPGMIATTLKFDYEVRSAEEAFAEIPALKMKGEMLDLARHIIETKTGRFEPEKFDDRYEAALADLVRAKIDGKPIKPRKPAAQGKVVDLMEALRQSAGAMAKSKATPKRKAAAATPRRKAS